MRHVAPVRKQLGIRTVFNLLGPLTNPALVRRQVIGLYDKSLMKTYAETLLLLGADRVMVVRGEDGMDELTLTGESVIYYADAKDGILEQRLTPESLNLKRASNKNLRGGDAKENARIMDQLLDGSINGALLDASVLNAAAALLVAGVIDNLKDGNAMARESVSSGRARAVLERLRRRNGS
jgi:anthranilate phosphoribosyltransferase